MILSRLVLFWHVGLLLSWPRELLTIYSLFNNFTSLNQDDSHSSTALLAANIEAVPAARRWARRVSVGLVRRPVAQSERNIVSGRPGLIADAVALSSQR